MNDEAHRIEVLEKKLSDLTRWTLDLVQDQRSVADTLRARVAELEIVIRGAMNYLDTWHAKDVWEDMAKDGDPEAQMLQSFRTALTENGAKDE